MKIVGAGHRVERAADLDVYIVSTIGGEVDARIKLEPATPKKQEIQCVRTGIPT